MTQSANWSGTSFGTAYSYSNDALGNRTQRGNSTVQNSGYQLYTFDRLNRMIKSVRSGGGATFTYRADGQRTMKVASHSLTWHVTSQDSGYYDEDENNNEPTTRYYHDGQMPVEEDFLESVINDVSYEVTRYGLGARGVDSIEKYSWVTEESTLAYPVYDGHGNMIATLARSGSSFAISNNRLYDAWGGVNSGSATGDPSQRYCANLGHQQDDETGGLIYMRARYYEPSSGRFVSQDFAHDGPNWFVYCGNDPANRIDRTGNYSELAGMLMSVGVMPSMISWGAAAGFQYDLAIVTAAFAVRAFAWSLGAEALLGGSVDSAMATGVAGASYLAHGLPTWIVSRVRWMPDWLRGGLALLSKHTGQTATTPYIQPALIAIYVYTMTLCGALLAIDN